MNHILILTRECPDLAASLHTHMPFLMRLLVLATTPAPTKPPPIHNPKPQPLHMEQQATHGSFWRYWHACHDAELAQLHASGEHGAAVLAFRELEKQQPGGFAGAVSMMPGIYAAALAPVVLAMSMQYNMRIGGADGRDSALEDAEFFLMVFSAVKEAGRVSFLQGSPWWALELELYWAA